MELPTKGAYAPETSYTNRFPRLLPRTTASMRLQRMKIKLFHRGT